MDWKFIAAGSIGIEPIARRVVAYFGVIVFNLYFIILEIDFWWDYSSGISTISMTSRGRANLTQRVGHVHRQFTGCYVYRLLSFQNCQVSWQGPFWTFASVDQHYRHHHTSLHQVIRERILVWSGIFCYRNIHLFPVLLHLFSPSFTHSSEEQYSSSEVPQP